jgi:EAL domain-containing protein (putative c-di-GMP-specific phosphodiesterase class I)
MRSVETTIQTGTRFEFDIGMAFQPIVDMRDLSIFGYEALVRGPDGQPAAEVFRQVAVDNRLAFDHLCRARAVETAARLGLDTHLCINFMPEAVFDPVRGLRPTLDNALRAGFRPDQLVLEASEETRLSDPQRFATIMAEYKRQGFRTAVDDFGDGFAGLSFLADFQPDYLKIDIRLIRGIDKDRSRKAIVAAIAGVAADLGSKVIAEGVETSAEMRELREMGIAKMQGYLFSRPTFGALAKPDLCRRQGVCRAPERECALHLVPRAA